MYLNELYDARVVQRRREVAIRLLQSLGIACILLSALYLFVEQIRIGQMIFLIALPGIILLVFFWRVLYHELLLHRSFGEKVLVLGSAIIAKELINEIRDLQDSGFEVVGVFAEDNPQDEEERNSLDVKDVFPLHEFPDRAELIDDVDRVVVALGDRRGTFPFRTLLNYRFKGIHVEEVAGFYETLTGKIMLENLRPSWFIFSEGFRKSKFTLGMKRATDIVISAFLVALLSPLMFLFAILIKLGSKGPVIYKQDRVGQGWKDYTLYKFRSMIENAEAKGIQWAEDEDPRITRVGRVIRKYRIDELPQLFNILKGDMSFVGPRPERRFFVESLAEEIPYYPQRLFAKPGLSGWAQIKYHYGASKDDTREKLQYDLYYIKHMSFLFDMTIILDTVRVVFTGKGAR